MQNNVNLIIHKLMDPTTIAILQSLDRETMTTYRLTKELKKDRRVIQRRIELLTELGLIYCITELQMGKGKIMSCKITTHGKKLLQKILEIQILLNRLQQEANKKRTDIIRTKINEIKQIINDPDKLSGYLEGLTKITQVQIKKHHVNAILNEIEEETR